MKKNPKKFSNFTNLFLFSNKSRPKLTLKKSFSLNNITNSNKNNAKVVRILNSINNTQFNNNIRTKSNKIILDGDSLKIRNDQINKEINKKRKILIKIKEENKKKDEEIDKQSNLLDDILNINKKVYLETLNIFDKDKINNGKYNNELINNLWIQYHELVEKNNLIDSEIKKYKKNEKNTKYNELIIENKILRDQYNKYKYLYQELEKKNSLYEKKMSNKSDIENEILQKNFEILQLQEILKQNSAINIKYIKEKENLKKKILLYQSKNKEMNNKIKKLNQNYNYILMSKKDLEDNFYLMYNNNEDISSNINSNNVSSIINKSEEIKKDNINTVDEEKITNIESEINIKKNKNIKDENEDKNNIKNNESFSEKNSFLSNNNNENENTNANEN